MKGVRWAVTAVAVVVSLGGAYRLGRARAEGPPVREPLVFTGVLEQGGAPVGGSWNLSARLYPASAGGAAVCTTETAPVSVDRGWFSLTLSPTCQAAVAANPDLWIEVAASSGSAPPVVLPRAHLGAVPYAIEAQHAVEATRATPDGGLAADLAAITARLGRTEARAREVRSPGPLSSSMLDVPLGAAALGGTQRSVIVTVSAVGDYCHIVRSYLVHTGNTSHASLVVVLGGPDSRVPPVTTSSYGLDYDVGHVDIVPTHGPGCCAFFAGGAPDDRLAGITIRFRNMPSRWEWRYALTWLN